MHDLCTNNKQYFYPCRSVSLNNWTHAAAQPGQSDCHRKWHSISLSISLFLTPFLLHPPLFLHLSCSLSLSRSSFSLLTYLWSPVTSWPVLASIGLRWEAGCVIVYRIIRKILVLRHNKELPYAFVAGYFLFLNLLYKFRHWIGLHISATFSSICFHRLGSMTYLSIPPMFGFLAGCKRP